MAHWQTETTSLTSADPVREGRPVDLPAPLVSKVIAMKPRLANPRAMPLVRPWQPPRTEYGCTNTITRLPSFSAAVGGGEGLKIRASSSRPSAVSMVQNSLVLLLLFAVGILILTLRGKIWWAGIQELLSAHELNCAYITFAGS